MRIELVSLSAIRRAVLLASSSSLLLLSACGDLATAPEVPVAEPLKAPSLPASPPATVAPSALAGARFFVDPNSNARRQAEAWRSSRPADAAQIEKIAAQPQAIWFGDWTRTPYETVRRTTQKIVQQGAVPVYALYNIPLRDCDQYSRGGAASAAAYQTWIEEVARGIGESRAVVIVEPDGAALIECLSPADQEARFAMLRQAVRTLKAARGISVYVDAGHARWHSAEKMAARLQQAGIGEADGFSLNVSHYVHTEESIRYGEKISALVGGKHFVIDTGRNGNGGTAPYDWCNPPGQALGKRPTTNTGHPLVDAFLWVKNPGESDGECKDAPAAGHWWPEYALMLARGAAD